MSTIRFPLRFREIYKIFKRHEIGPKKSEEPVLWDIKQVIEVSGLTEAEKCAEIMGMGNKGKAEKRPKARSTEGESCA